MSRSGGWPRGDHAFYICLQRCPLPPTNSCLAQVWVKILEVRQEGPGNFKIAASRRAVDQDSGADLDPDNLLAQGKWLMLIG